MVKEHFCPAHTLQGAGASFPAPIHQHWLSELAANRAIQVNYQAWGLQKKTFAYILIRRSPSPSPRPWLYQP
jgi:hypothetical protein